MPLVAPQSRNTQGGEHLAVLTRLDREVLGYVSCRRLPSQFACHQRSPEAIIASVNKDEVRARCRELGCAASGSLSQMLVAIAKAIIAREGMRALEFPPFPLQFVSLNHVMSFAAGAAPHPPPGPCWLCGCSTTCVGLDNIADLQVGSWPPGDARRWQFGQSFVVPVSVCHGYYKAQTAKETAAGEEPLAAAATAAAAAAILDSSSDCDSSTDSLSGRHSEAPAPVAPPHRLAPDCDVLELRKQLYNKASSRLPCKVGDFPTISGVLWEGRWRTLDEIMTCCTDKRLPDAVIPCPEQPCIERVCLQLLNWFSMSGLDKADKNCLPARVYLTRPARLVCRAGQVVGYMTYTATANEHFPTASVCAIYVRPEARGKGACRALLYDFVREARAAKGLQTGPESLDDDVSSLDCDRAGDGAQREGGVAENKGEIYGIEAPVSKALLSALPKMFKAEMLKKFRVIQHGDTPEQLLSRNTLWSDVCRHLGTPD